MSESKCRSLAQKKVPGASITSIRLKYDDGIDQYKVKMKKGNKKYELEYHARTRELIGYGKRKSSPNRVTIIILGPRRQNRSLCQRYPAQR